MQWLPGKFPAVVILVEMALILIFAFCVDYDEQTDARSKLRNITSSAKPNRNVIQDFYPMFQDVNVMIFIGFGFLMTFLKKYGYGAIGLNMLLAAISIQWAIVMQGVWDMTNKKIHVGIKNLINGNFASATVLISYGALLGKASPLQLVVMAVVEITIFACNEHLGVSIFKAADIGGSIFLHTFGAYFGLSASYVMYRKEWKDNTKEGAVYHSDIFAMIGTVFLWMFWPSFNSAMGVGDEQHRSVINTYCAMLACCVVTFAISSMTDGERKLNMVHIQNATLAGGVAVGSTANMMLHPYGALLVGAVAAILSTLGYRYLTPFLLKKLRIHDTCGVNNLHGMPGIMAGFVSAIVASLATESEYGHNLYKLYPSRSPAVNTTEYIQMHSLWKDLDPGYSWSAQDQAVTQIKALFSTLAVAITGGALTGYLLLQPIFEPPKSAQLFDDNDFWEVPEDTK